MDGGGKTTAQNGECGNDDGEHEDHAVEFDHSFAGQYGRNHRSDQLNATIGEDASKSAACGGQNDEYNRPRLLVAAQSIEP